MLQTWTVLKESAKCHRDVSDNDFGFDASSLGNAYADRGRRGASIQTCEEAHMRARPRAPRSSVDERLCAPDPCLGMDYDST